MRKQELKKMGEYE